MKKPLTHQPALATEPRFSRLVEIMAGEEGQVPSEIHILSTGSWKTTSHGSFDIAEPDLDEMVKNFNDSVRKGVPIDEEHNTTGGAVGWINELSRRGRDLFASVSWNSRGSNALADKQYKYFSPEFAPRYQDPETGSSFKNVLLGGGITNRPLFKNLKPIMASEDGNNILYLNEDNLMDIEALKAKAPADLTEDERKFLTDNGVTVEVPKVEEKPAEEKPVVEEKPVEEVKGSETVTITASELADFRKMQGQFSEMRESLKQKECSEKVTGWEFNEKGEGKFSPTLHDDLTGFVLSLNETQAKAFEALVEKLPNKKVFGEIGDNGEEKPEEAKPHNAGAYSVKGSAYAELETKANEVIKASDGKTSFGRALLTVRKANPDLAAKADEENAPIKATRE